MKFESRFSEATRQDLLLKSKKCIWMQEGSPGLQYLQEARCLSEDVIRTFGLGFIPHDVKNQLAGRIIAPLNDASGNLISLTSRLVSGYESRLPIHWHESYEKSFYLFGIDHAKKCMREMKFAVVVEGEFDVLQMHNHGIRNAVGLCCSKMSDIQISLIHRYCDEIVLVLDSDENRAGQEAAQKIMKNTLRHTQMKPDSMGDFLKSFHSRYKIIPLELPRGMDPDEVLRQGGAARMKSKIKEKITKLRESEYVEH